MLLQQICNKKYSIYDRDMKIAFTGKGGSGKTTVASLFARIAADDGYKVLAMDADINQHLAAAIGYEGTLRSMGTESDVIKQHLLGTNPYAKVETMHKTMPPGHGSELLQAQSDDWFIREFAVSHQGVWLAGAGEIPEGNVGVRCYHGLNGAVELVLGHLVDRQDDIVLVDMTAGADAFSSSLFTKVDALLLVVEPTQKSIGVYQQFIEHADRYGIPLIIIANKIQDAEDRAFISKFVPGVAAWLPVSGSIRRQERGDGVQAVETDIAQALRGVRDQLLTRPIDWQKREALSHKMHARASSHSQIDPDFSLTEAVL
jgi:CO dehydrogenase maturation factor